MQVPASVASDEQLLRDLMYSISLATTNCLFGELPYRNCISYREPLWNARGGHTSKLLLTLPVWKQSSAIRMEVRDPKERVLMAGAWSINVTTFRAFDNFNSVSRDRMKHKFFANSVDSQDR